MKLIRKYKFILAILLIITITIIIVINKEKLMDNSDYIVTTSDIEIEEEINIASKI